MNTPPALPAKDLHWFQLANANPPRGFYPFKERFLKRFATQDGYDSQTIHHPCWTCDGTGIYSPKESCRACGGNGVHHTSSHWLQRWDLAGKIYYKPVEESTLLAECNGRLPDPVREFEGKVTKLPVPDHVAERCFYRLLLRHEPAIFHERQFNRILFYRRTKGKKAKSFKWLFRLIRIRNNMDLFDAIPSPQDSTTPLLQ
jgi:hypothetical protein